MDSQELEAVEELELFAPICSVLEA